MTTATLERPGPSAPAPERRPADGGAPARRAVTRWGWRLFRREWRQQLLVLALIVVAVAATTLAATVAVDTKQPADLEFGTAQYMATLQSSGPRLASQIAALEHRVGRVDVIENELNLPIPGSTQTYDLRSQDPHGPYGQPMLQLSSGRYPANGGEVAVTPYLASELNLRIGDAWKVGGRDRTVVGTVQNPLSLLDEFALVVAGQVTSPTQTTVLFDLPPGVKASSLGPNITSVNQTVNTNVLNPATVMLTLTTVGMLLIALVSIGGFTVLAQRRLRAIGLLGSVGASPRHVRLVVRANGVIVGVVGAVLGVGLGVVAWLAYRPHAEATSHHLIAAFALPWLVIGFAVVLAVAATYFAASRPARAVARLPIVTALAGRPAPPKAVHRSAIPGVIAAVIAFFLFLTSGASSDGGAVLPLVLGFIVLIVAIVLLAPLCLSILALVGRHSPVPIRLAARDLARYRSRSASALAAISLGILIAMTISVLAAARYGNVLDYAGPNLASNQLIVYTPNGGPNGNGNGSPAPPSAVAAELQAKAGAIASALGATSMVELLSTDASLNHNAPGRNFTGQLYVATPQLLHAFGISPSSIDPSADILTMRPGLSGISDLQLQYPPLQYPPPSQGQKVLITPGGGSGGQNVPLPGPPTGANGNTANANTANGCTAATYCLANPVIQEVSQLPSGTSAPNTVLTEHAVKTLDLASSFSNNGWLIQSAQAITAAQINQAQAAAATDGMSIESKNDEPTSDEVINWATVFGVCLALAILAMAVGLIRSETANDLRTLSATGASSFTRRSLAGATAGGLALLGAVMGTVAAYLVAIAWFKDNANNGGLSALSSMPVTNLLVVLIGLPLVAALGGWLLGGRDPKAIAHQPSR